MNELVNRGTANGSSGLTTTQLQTQLQGLAPKPGSGFLDWVGLDSALILGTKANGPLPSELITAFTLRPSPLCF